MTLRASASHDGASSLCDTHILYPFTICNKHPIAPQEPHGESFKLTLLDSLLYSTGMLHLIPYAVLDSITTLRLVADGTVHTPETFNP
jgi:hypothetical protein